MSASARPTSRWIERTSSSSATTPAGWSWRTSSSSTDCHGGTSSRSNASPHHHADCCQSRGLQCSGSDDIHRWLRGTCHRRCRCTHRRLTLQRLHHRLHLLHLLHHCFLLSLHRLRLLAEQRGQLILLCSPAQPLPLDLFIVGLLHLLYLLFRRCLCRSFVRITLARMLRPLLHQQRLETGDLVGHRRVSRAGRVPTPLHHLLQVYHLAFHRHCTNFCLAQLLTCL
mmetsp:Transcript_51177/g.121637  ORF Transcript_51177/g.121637 Transcript_51177/m.121637 type:complete len:226 (-) Transcript_51177:833-1510(-)